MNARSTIKMWMTVAALAVSAVMSSAAFADKVYLKNGNIIDGKVKSNDGTSLVFVEMKDGKEVQTHYLSISDEVSRVVVEESKPAAPATPAPVAATPAKSDKPADTAKTSEPGATKAADSAKPEKSKPAITGRPTRVAFINYGPPSSWQGKVQNMVGIQIAAKPMMDIIPILEKEKIDVVVVRINSGGGYSHEMWKLSNMFQTEYKPRFRTVAWIEWAISAAAMSPWILEEFYMMPEGAVGGCTEFRGGGIATQGIGLQNILFKMEEVSKKAHRDPKIMRSMQIREPLSANIDADGNVTFFNDESGNIKVNPPGQVLTLTAPMAMQIKFAKGVAATPEELCRAMGLVEFEIAGKQASDYIDSYMRKTQEIETKFQEVAAKYDLAVQAARQARNNREVLQQEAGLAMRYLKQMKDWVGTNENFRFHLAGNLGIEEITPEWFEQQETMLKRLLAQAANPEPRR
ncbi:MAG: hypothetical protein ACREJO_03790 [Phycisphaerales bacterium]